MGRFRQVLAHLPDSAFLAEGSEVTVFKGEPITEPPNRDDRENLKGNHEQLVNAYDACCLGSQPACRVRCFSPFDFTGVFSSPRTAGAN